MDDRTQTLNLLFLCTGNSARSIMGEALACDRSLTGGRLCGHSAGSQPAGRVHPEALATLTRHGHRLPAPRSKSWDEFTGADAPRIDLLVTVCDSAAAEVCPVWPGRPVTSHWGVPDPAAIATPGAEQTAAFESAYATLRRRLEAFVATLPDTPRPDQIRQLADAAAELP